MKTKHLFVYGTLKRSHILHSILSGCQYVRDGVVRGFVLLDLDAFPGLVPGRSPSEPPLVFGEVYTLPEDSERMLRRLDQTEQEGRFYTRVIIPVYNVTSLLEPPQYCYAYLYMPYLDAATIPRGNF